MILIGDLHLTDNARDQYRFGIFDWIKRQQVKYNPAATFLAGDITNAKDRHSATLVNKIVEGLISLRPPIYICRGNHDYRDPNNPFFRFLNNIEGIVFVVDPIVVANGIAIIPHYRTQEEFDTAVGLAAASAPRAFLCHQTFDGAIAETGARLTGLSASPIELFKPELGVYAGDVHMPQRQGMVTYIGCPYQVRFGDDFNPRSIWVDQNGKNHNLYFDAPFKWSLKIRDEHDLFNHGRLAEGDQVKLTIELAREEAVEWKTIKANVLAACRELKLEVFGVKLEINSFQPTKRIKHEKGKSHASTFEQFCKSENLSKSIQEAGRFFVEKEHGN